MVWFSSFGWRFSYTRSGSPVLAGGSALHDLMLHLTLLQVFVESCRLDGQVVLDRLLPLSVDHSLVGPLQGLAAEGLAGAPLLADLGRLQALHTDRAVIMTHPNRYSSIFLA